MATKITGTEGVDLIKDGTVKAADFDPSLFLASKTINGYQKLPSGLIIQWGITSGTGDRDVTFPIPFPNEALSVTGSVFTGNSTINNITYSVNISYLNAFSVRFTPVFWNGSATGVAGSGEQVRWIAIGY